MIKPLTGSPVSPQGLRRKSQLIIISWFNIFENIDWILKALKKKSTTQRQSIFMFAALFPSVYLRVHTHTLTHNWVNCQKDWNVPKLSCVYQQLQEVVWNCCKSTLWEKCSKFSTVHQEIPKWKLGKPILDKTKTVWNSSQCLYPIHSSHKD